MARSKDTTSAYDKAPIVQLPTKRLSADGADAWRGSLLWRVTKTGEVLKSDVANIITILGNDPRWLELLAFDAFTESTVKLREPPWHEHDRAPGEGAGEWTDADVTRAMSWLSREWGVAFSRAAVSEAVDVVARRHVRHPVRDYLESLTWDQGARLDRMLCDYFGATNSEYTRAVGSRWMKSACARVYEPGCKVDCVLVLEGQQGTGKSTGLGILGGSWFSDTAIAIGEKDGYQVLRGRWILELAELSSLSGRDMNKVKAFLSAANDSYRASYARSVRTHRRQCVFCASTNDTEYLRDATGNRRFWPVACGRVDVAGLRRDRDQLWAEARERYKRGESYYVDTRQLAELCHAEQEQRRERDPWTPVVEKWIGAQAHSTYTTTEILLGAMEMKTAQIKRSDSMRVAEVLRDLGYIPGPQQREVGKKVRRYIKKT